MSCLMDCGKMETPSMDTVYQAISALYDNPNASEKEKASNWLGDVQKSVSRRCYHPTSFCVP